MTAYKARVSGKTPKSNNKKDGARRPPQQSNEFETAGFTLIEPPGKWSYTLQGVFPVFHIKPGIINGLGGLVARCDEAGVIEWFPYGTPANEIKIRLNALILQIMRHEAGLADIPLDWYPDEIDIDDFMSDGEWVNV